MATLIVPLAVHKLHYWQPLGCIRSARRVQHYWQPLGCIRSARKGEVPERGSPATLIVLLAAHQQPYWQPSGCISSTRRVACPEGGASLRGSQYIYAHLISAPGLFSQLAPVLTSQIDKLYFLE